MHSEQITPQNRYIFIRHDTVNRSTSKASQDLQTLSRNDANSFSSCHHNCSSYNLGNAADLVVDSLDPLRNPTRILINPHVVNNFVMQHSVEAFITHDSVKASNVLINPHYEKLKAPKVLVNPHFKKTVYVNPNFNQNHTTNENHTTKLNIHVNPNIIHGDFERKTIAVNRKVLQSHNDKLLKLSHTINYGEKASQNLLIGSSDSTPSQINAKKVKIDEVHSSRSKPSTIISTKSKFIHIKENDMTCLDNKTLKKRRSSIKTQYKIVKSNILNETPITKNSVQKGLYSSRYKVMRKPTIQTENRKSNQYKIDNRSTKTKYVKECIHRSSKRKYVYIDKFFSMKYIANSVLIKQGSSLRTPGYINVNGILYKSPNSIRKVAAINKTDVLNRPICKSRYKIVKKCLSSANLKSNHVRLEKSNTPKLTKNIKLVRTKSKRSLPNKLRKSNVPCSIYRKYGKCSGKDNGKCIKIHNPNQVVLCTKFLQGACLKTNCLLSHKVSAEKMPTCKYFLEGTCSREDCQYLHVKISPKADICKNFLEGFCEKAAECDRRHQFLCPDYEKYGTCPRRRCSYPHGNMVRYSHARKKFAKKCSVKPIKEVLEQKHKHHDNTVMSKPVTVDTNLAEKLLNVRYYDTSDKLAINNTDSVRDENNHEKTCDYEVYVKNRPKLGSLPSYIPLFEEGS